MKTQEKPTIMNTASKYRVAFKALKFVLGAAAVIFVTAFLVSWYQLAGEPLVAEGVQRHLSNPNSTWYTRAATHIITLGQYL